MLNKEEIRNYVYSKRDFIEEQYQKHGNSPSTDIKITNEIKELLMRTELEEYNQKTKEFDSFLRGKYLEIDAIHNKQGVDIQLLKNTYYEKIADEIVLMIKHLENEKNNLKDTSLQIKEVSSIVKDIETFIKQNNTILEYLINNLNSINTEFKQALDASIKQVYENVHIKTKELTKQLENIKDETIKNLNKQVEEKNKDIIAQKDEKISKIKNSIDTEMYKKTLASIETKKNENTNGLLIIDISNIIKYSVFIGFTILFVWIDFFIALDAVTNTLDFDDIKERYRDNPKLYNSYIFVFMSVIPIMFSGGLIFVEYISKYTKGIWKNLLHIFTIGIAILIIALPIFDRWEIINSTNPDLLFPLLEVITRIIMFLGVILSWGYILRKYVKENELIDFIKDTLFFPIRLFVIMPIIYATYFLDILLLKFKKRVLLGDIDELEKQTKQILIKPINIITNYDDFGILNTESIEKKYGSIGIINSFTKNIDDMIFKMSAIDNLLNQLSINFGKNDGVIGNRINNLRDKINDFTLLFNQEKEKIVAQYKFNIDEKTKLINEVMEEREIDRANFNDYEILVKNSILEGLILLKSIL